MEPLLAAIQASEPATFLRFSRWSYAAVNTAHVLGIALLVGSIVPLDLRLLGAWQGTDRRSLIRVLVPVAAFGLALAIAAGALLFSVRAADYAALLPFRIKLALILAGTLSALTLHAVHGRSLATASPARLRLAALLSITCWLGALILGRLVAFAGD